MKVLLLLLLQIGIYCSASAQKFDTIVKDYRPTIQIPAIGNNKLVRTSPRTGIQNALRMSVPDGRAHDIGIYFAPGHRPGTGLLIARGRTYGIVDIPTQVGSYIICSLELGKRYLKIVMLHVFDDRIDVYQINNLERNNQKDRQQKVVSRS